MKNSVFFVRFIALALLALLVAVPAQSRELAEPKLLAVYFYADWCSSCKILSPKLTEARKKGKLDREDILFVKLDLSNKVAIHQSILTAQAMDFGSFLQKQGSSTGYVAVLDATSKNELVRFDKDSSADSILSAIHKELATVNQ